MSINDLLRLQAAIAKSENTLAEGTSGIDRLPGDSRLSAIRDFAVKHGYHIVPTGPKIYDLDVGLH